MKVFAGIVVAALGILAMGLNLAEAGPPRLPLSVSGPQWRPLSQRGDQKLQARLELALKQHASWRPLLVQGKMSVGLVDLSNPKAPRRRPGERQHHDVRRQPAETDDPAGGFSGLRRPQPERYP